MILGQDECHSVRQRLKGHRRDKALGITKNYSIYFYKLFFFFFKFNFFINTFF